MITVSEKDRIIKCDQKAVNSRVSLTGWEVEAYLDDKSDTAVARIMDASSVLYAQITESQHKSLSEACDREVVGAKASDDIRIMQSAYNWFHGNNLDWHWVSADGTRFVPDGMYED